VKVKVLHVPCRVTSSVDVRCVEDVAKKLQAWLNDNPSANRARGSDSGDGQLRGDPLLDSDYLLPRLKPP
jgi:hypothetical protein